ncbi:unnamed protein product [Amoebophrya sp. A25]|nr:unnamed protein product [Amoebophrya sp. A25]|eukprot:GSA25T00006861001.1
MPGDLMWNGKTNFQKERPNIRATIARDLCNALEELLGDLPKAKRAGLKAVIQELEQSEHDPTKKLGGKMFNENKHLRDGWAALDHQEHIKFLALSSGRDRAKIARVITKPEIALKLCQKLGIATHRLPPGDSGAPNEQSVLAELNVYRDKTGNSMWDTLDFLEHALDKASTELQLRRDEQRAESDEEESARLAAYGAMMNRKTKNLAIMNHPKSDAVFADLKAPARQERKPPSPQKDCPRSRSQHRERARLSLSPATMEAAKAKLFGAKAYAGSPDIIVVEPPAPATTTEEKKVKSYQLKPDPADKDGMLLVTTYEDGTTSTTKKETAAPSSSAAIPAPPPPAKEEEKPKDDGEKVETKVESLPNMDDLDKFMEEAEEEEDVKKKKGRGKKTAAAKSKQKTKGEPVPMEVDSSPPKEIKTAGKKVRGKQPAATEKKKAAPKKGGKKAAAEEADDDDLNKEMAELLTKRKA